MLALVVLGNRMNDDGTLTDLAERRLQAAVRLDKAFAPQYIILSGGLANPTAGRTEASAMAARLVELGVDRAKLVSEDKSLTTKENALFTLPVAAGLGVTELVVVTSNEHMSRNFLNPIKLFTKVAKDYPSIQIRTYSE